MEIDWSSSETYVFLNPKINESEKKYYIHKLYDCDFSGHIWLATSGTSGKFKFVALSKEALLHSAKAVNEHFQITSSDRWINVLPTFHVGGVGIFARAYLSSSQVFNLYSSEEKWNPQKFVLKIKEFQATLSALVPTQLYDLIKEKIKSPKSLRAVIIGGGRLNSTLQSQAEKLGWKLFPSYGLTECASQVATYEDHKMKILDHIQIKIDNEGFIHLKSPSLLTAYATIDRETKIIDPKVEGWLNTLDKGSLDGKFLTVFGRGKDFFKIGGENVNLCRLQDLLESLKGELKIECDVLLTAKEEERLGATLILEVEGLLDDNIQLLVKVYNEKVLPFERIRELVSMPAILRNFLGKPIFDFFN